MLPSKAAGLARKVAIISRLTSAGALTPPWRRAISDSESFLTTV